MGYTRGRTFEKKFKCFSMKKMSRSSQLENGGKILLPPSSLEILSGLNIMYPMLFEVSSDKTQLKTHCGVLEFTAEEGRAYLPSWMMAQIGISDGEIITIKSTSLSQGSFVKLQPQSTTFLDISNPKAVLEKELTNFACLTVDDKFPIAFNGKIYEMKVIELKPKDAVNIIEADIQVDFMAPPGYVEPNVNKETSPPSEDEPMPDVDKFVPFKGSGNSLRGVPIPIASALKQQNASGSSPGKKSPSPSPSASPSPRPGSFMGSPSPKPAAPIALPPGKLIFGSSSSTSLAKSFEAEKSKSVDGFVAFGGKGNSLR